MTEHADKVRLPLRALRDVPQNRLCLRCRALLELTW